MEFDQSTDTDILITGGIYWSLIECGVGLISCCLPATYGVFRRIVLRASDATQRVSLRYHSEQSRKHGLSLNPGRGFQRQVDYSQAGDVELAAIYPAHTNNKTSAEGPTDEAREAIAISPRNQILVTKTFAAEKQSTSSVNTRKGNAVELRS